jgi:tripartite-type tricarboxylate transporter receptor subunit TctC
MSGFGRRGVLAGALALPLPAAAQEAWPSRAVTLVVPFVPGGAVDNALRPIADGLRRRISQPVVIENRAGAGGLVGTRLVAAGRPDGYTLLIGSSGPLVIAPAAGAADAPDPLRALAPVALLAESPQLLVVANALPVTTLDEFVALARTRPGALNMGSAGVGTTPHLAMELLSQVAGLRMEHVPYRGTGAAIPDVMAGKVEAMFGDMSALLPLVEGGRVRALATTAPVRTPLAPHIPTTTEAGFPALVVRNWQAVLAPPGTPDPVLRRIAAAFGDAVEDETVRAALARQGSTPTRSGPEHLTEFLRAERATWEPVVRASGLRLE